MPITLEHLADLDRYKIEKPYYLAQIPGFESGESTNLEYSFFHRITIHDARGHENLFSVDKHSFTFKRLPSYVAYNKSEEANIAYMKETIELVRSHFRTDRIICYDIRRRLNTPMTNEQESSNDRALQAPAVTAIHIDHTREGGFHRVRRHLSEEEAARYLSGEYRTRIINVWRPLFRTITESPLAFCDARTLSEEDLVPADRVSPEYAGEIYYVRPSKQQSWYWLSDMTPGDVTIFLSFDSANSNLGSPINYCAHGSFTNPMAPPNAPPRESVEVRLILFTEKGQMLPEESTG
ncbi:hypothetical protein QQX98_012098 [Neonectria punicea]|uniref:Methyltransferase n=1 Tax=Neonectria punicea TaxID=979145 RepID=A0ABR1GJT5_9HYPO